MKAYNVYYYGWDDELIDQTQIDEKDEEHAKNLFQEFGHSLDNLRKIEFEETEEEPGKIHITQKVKHFDHLNHLELRSDIENNNIYDCHIIPEGKTSAEPERWSLDCETSDESHVTGYHYDSRAEYEQDIKILTGKYDPYKGVEKIDCMPTWLESLSVYIACIENGQPEGVKASKADLSRMARLADQRNEMANLLKECLLAFNEIPKYPVHNGECKNTYEIASKIEQILNIKI